jgi:hypothetical protein
MTITFGQATFKGACVPEIAGVQCIQPTVKFFLDSRRSKPCYGGKRL